MAGSKGQTLKERSNERTIMKDLFYRGAVVVPQNEKSRDDVVLNYRGQAYDLRQIKPDQKATSGQYRGATWSV